MWLLSRLDGFEMSLEEMSLTMTESGFNNDRNKSGFKSEMCQVRVQFDGFLMEPQPLMFSSLSDEGMGEEELRSRKGN